MQTLTAWRPSREDWRAILLVALAPALLAAPQLTWLNADPLYYTSALAYDLGPVIQRGVPYIDPNNGFQTQALGYRAAADWLSGEVPWWNPYSGIGMPLAAEYQASAFFPPTLLLLLPGGPVLLQTALRMLAGLGTYALLRQLGLRNLAATTGGVLYAVNGTLALFAHGPASVVPTLPWILLGIERAHASRQSFARGGWRLLAAALAASLLAGFPELAFINGLLALAWATVRGLQLQPESRRAFASRILVAGVVALLVSSPQTVSFFLYLADSDIGEHAALYAHAHLPGLSVVATFVAPYLWGPIFGYAPQWPTLYTLWGTMGGYASLALVATAVYGLLRMPDRIGLLLAAWTATAVAKMMNVEPFASAWNFIPGIAHSAFFRYSQPSIELALVILASRGIDETVRGGPSIVDVKRTALIAAAICIAASAFVSSVLNEIPAGSGLASWMAASAVWAVGFTALILGLLASARTRARVITFAFALAAEGAFLCFIPVLSNPRGGTVATAGIHFLQEHLGLQRFYTLGPIAPNYGAYFAIASINHNYLPVPKAWVRHVSEKLDRSWKDPAVFNGDSVRHSDDELRTRLREYEALGVKYIVSHSHLHPLAGMPGVKEVFHDRGMRIVELPAPSPYFETMGARCDVIANERTAARVSCPDGSTLLRRELYLDGWTATVNGKDVPVKPLNTVFQSIGLPRGTSEVRFSYAPPHIAWAWLAMWVGLASLAAPSLLLLRRNHQ